MNVPKIIFLHVPKTAGVSVFHTFKDLWLDMQGRYNTLHIDASVKQGIFTGHVPLWKLIEDGTVEEEYLKDAIIFFILRNCYDRFVSLYYYLDFKNKAKNEKRWSIMEFAENVKVAPKDRHNLGHPYSYWLRGLEGLVSDPIYSLGFRDPCNLQRSLDTFCRQVGLPSRRLQYMNTNKNYTCSAKEVYEQNPGLKEIVTEIYTDDIAKFHMVFPY